MAGIDFNREAFLPAQNQASGGAPRLLGAVILLVAVTALGFVGYRLYADYARNQPSVESQGAEQIQQQLTDMQRRIDQLEKHRKAVMSEPSTTPSKTVGNSAAAASASQQTTYKISAASVLQPPTNPSRHLAPLTQPPSPQAAAAQPSQALSEESAAANHEAWRATTDRLTDVVGVVGSQQEEISRAREEINRLLAQTRRTALQFELRRGAKPEPVGPVSLLLKSSDTKTHVYTVCVYLDNQCIELKNRAVDEVVVFVLSSNSAPLELVATKVLRDQIVGYLEIPVDKQGP